jgi:hypothetical protein
LRGSLRIPSVEIAKLATEVEARLQQDPIAGLEMLRRMLGGGALADQVHSCGSDRSNR